MRDEEKTKDQPITELAEMRRRIAESEDTEAHRWWTGETLRALVEGTASATGDDFFRSLVYNLASVLRARYAFVGEFADMNSKVRTLAFWNGQGFIENFEFALAGTPCEQVLAGEIRHYPQGVQALFPTDKDLVKLGAESYLAIPLMDRLRNVLGHLAVLDTKSMPAKPRDISILKIFAARGAAELERKRAKEALRLTQFSFDRAGDAAFWIDSQARFFYVNDAACRSLGYSREELLSMTVHDIDPNYRAQVWPDHWRALKQSGSLTFESHHRAKDGRIFPVEITVNYLEFGDKEYNCAFARDITERKQAEKRINASLHEKEVLLKEIHHRVKNNLQVISSILRLQAGYIEGHKAGKMITESQHRIKSMALVHEKLYQSKDLGKIDFAEYIPELAAYLFRSHGANRRTIKLKTNVPRTFLKTDTAVPCGLIITELVSNALKHAFPAVKKGEIRIGFRSDTGKRFTLTVSDNGVGFRKDIDFRNTRTLGMRLVRTLTDQLDGTIELDRQKGTSFKIHFADIRRKKGR